MSNLQIVKTSFQQTAIKEIAYRKLDLSPKDVLQDIIETSLLVSKIPWRGKNDTPELLELIDGLKRFKPFPIAVKYRPDDGVLSASKAAYLATLLHHGKSGIQSYSEDTELVEINFPDKFKHITKLKRRLPEAYYYLYKAIEIIAK